jgi:hypothetical protein
MIVTCRVCGEEFSLTPDHKGFANTCEDCFRPQKLTSSELKAARSALDERNGLQREDAERETSSGLLQDRRRIEASWSDHDAQEHLRAYQKWLEDRFPDDAESFRFFFVEMKESRRQKFYLGTPHRT